MSQVLNIIGHEQFTHNSMLACTCGALNAFLEIKQAEVGTDSATRERLVVSAGVALTCRECYRSVVSSYAAKVLEGWNARLIATQPKTPQPIHLTEDQKREIYRLRAERGEAAAKEWILDLIDKERDRATTVIDAPFAEQPDDEGAAGRLASERHKKIGELTNENERLHNAIEGMALVISRQKAEIERYKEFVKTMESV